MGAWGSGHFENDDALDWLAEFEAEGLQAAGGAIADVLSLEGEYLEAPTASRALAAAEVIAAASGNQAQGLPDPVLSWLSSHPLTRSTELLMNAATAVRRVLAESELRDLWFEGESGAEWEASVNALLQRLR
jgi:hypothetical protein